MHSNDILRDKFLTNYQITQKKKHPSMEAAAAAAAAAAVIHNIVQPCSRRPVPKDQSSTSHGLQQLCCTTIVQQL